MSKTSKKTSKKSPAAQTVRIYQPTRNAMQQGRARTGHWVLEFPPAPNPPEPIMGWLSGNDTREQIHLEFPTLDEALTYARQNNLDPEVIEPNWPHHRKKSYADNFLD